MAERDAGAQQTNFEESEDTISWNTSGSNSSLKELKKELASIVSGSAGLRDDLDKILAGFRNEGNLGGQIEARPAHRTRVKSPGADNPVEVDIRASGAYISPVYGSETGKLDAVNPGAENQRTQRRDWM